MFIWRSMALKDVGRGIIAIEAASVEAARDKALIMADIYWRTRYAEIAGYPYSPENADDTAELETFKRLVSIDVTPDPEEIADGLFIRGDV